MLARFFQKSEPISFVSLLLLLFVHVVVQATVASSGQFGLGSFTGFLGVFLFYVFLIFLVSFIITKNHLTPANYYAILFFVLLIGLFPTVLKISNISLSHLFVMLAVRRIYSIYSKKMLLYKLFDSGFYLGVAFLFYPQSILYLILIYASYFIYIKIIDKNLFLGLIGFITPIFIVFTYYYVFDKTSVFNSMIEMNIGFELLKLTETEFLIPLVSIALVLIFSLFKIFSKFQAFEGKDKNGTKLVIAHLVISMLFLLLNNLRIEESIQYVFFPIAVLAGNLFYLLKKYWIKDVILYGLLILAFILAYLPNFT